MQRAAAALSPLEQRASVAITVQLTKKISEQARKGELEDAINLFDEMPQKNQVTWNALLSALVSSGHLDSAHKLFDRMPTKNSRSYTSVIAGLSSMGAVIRARQVFDSIPSRNRNVFTWTAMITCYVQNDEPLQALRLFKHVYGRFASPKIVPNPHTFSVVLKACSSVQCLSMARQVQSLIVKHLDEEDRGSIFVLNSLIDVNAKLGNLVDAECLFRRMRHKDLATMNTMMDAYAYHLFIDKALDIFSGMREKDTLSWNIVMSGLLECGRGEEALEMFICLLRLGRDRMPNSSTYTIVLSSCATLAMAEFGRQVHASTLKIGLYSSNIFVSNSLITMYASCGLTEELRQVFDEMPKKDTISWNSAIQGLGRNGQAGKALEIADMALRSKNYNHNTFTAILTTCSHGGLVAKGLEYFDVMGRKYGIKPSFDHCICLIDMLGRAGKIDEAHEFLNEKGLGSSSVAWVTLLNACCIHGNSEVGRIAAERLQGLEPENVRGYSAMASVCSRTGRVEESRRLSDLVTSKDLGKKNPGCSWVIGT